MKQGDIVDAYGDCLRKKYPLGKAKLLKQIKESGCVQYWNVEFLNEPGIVRDILIKKPDGKNK